MLCRHGLLVEGFGQGSPVHFDVTLYTPTTGRRTRHTAQRSTRRCALRGSPVGGRLGPPRRPPRRRPPGSPASAWRRSRISAGQISRETES